MLYSFTSISRIANLSVLTFIALSYPFAAYSTTPRPSPCRRRSDISCYSQGGAASRRANLSAASPFTFSIRRGRHQSARQKLFYSPFYFPSAADAPRSKLFDSCWTPICCGSFTYL